MNAAKTSNIFSILVIGLFLFSLLYILEVNFIIQDTFTVKQLKKQAQEILLKNQLLSAQASLYVYNEDEKALKDKFHLTEVKTFLALEQKATQFSLRQSPYE